MDCVKGMARWTVQKGWPSGLCKRVGPAVCAKGMAQRFAQKNGPVDSVKGMALWTVQKGQAGLQAQAGGAAGAHRKVNSLRMHVLMRAAHA